MTMLQAGTKINCKDFQPELRIGHRLRAVSASSVQHCFPSQVLGRHMNRVQEKPFHPVFELHTPVATCEIKVVPFVAEAVTRGSVMVESMPCLAVSLDQRSDE